MQESRFREYIDRFNARDATAFEDFLHDDVRVKNGTLEFTGVDGMKAHYEKIWKDFEEVLDVSDFTTDGDPNGTAAIRMNTDFTALHDAPDSLFGPVKKGDRFRFEGLIMYQLRDDKYASILVAYNHFWSIPADGDRVDLGIPH